MRRSLKLVLRIVGAIVVAIVLLAAAYVGNVVLGMHVAATTKGTLSGLGVIETRG